MSEQTIRQAAEVAREIATDVIVADLRAQLKTAQCSAEDRSPICETLEFGDLDISPPCRRPKKLVPLLLCGLELGAEIFVLLGLLKIVQICSV